MRTRVKICGITRNEDAQMVARYGADAIGLVFYPPSPRNVSIEQAREVVKNLPAFVSVVALFVDAEPSFVREVLAGVNIDLLQFHGQESVADCEQFEKPYIKAIAMHEGVDLKQEANRFSGAAGLLVDTYNKDTPGGTGQVFDWDMLPDNCGKPLILAGGLDSRNVKQAIESVYPYAVDVSSGVERDKGIKDEGKVSAFIRGVNSV